MSAPHEATHPELQGLSGWQSEVQLPLALGIERAQTDGTDSLSVVTVG